MTRVVITPSALRSAEATIHTTGWKEETAGEHADQVHDVFARVLRDDQKPHPVPAPVAAASQAA